MESKLKDFVSTFKNKPKVITVAEEFKRRSSKCPFCGGSKIKPFISPFRSQNCTECNKKGEILNSKLRKMGLDDFIEKNFA